MRRVIVNQVVEKHSLTATPNPQHPGTRFPFAEGADSTYP